MAITYPLTLAQAQAITGADAKEAAICVAVLSKCDATKGTWVDPGDHLPELRGGSESPAFLAQLAAAKGVADMAAVAAQVISDRRAALKALALARTLKATEIQEALALLL